MTDIYCQWCNAKIETIIGNVRVAIPKYPKLGIEGTTESAYLFFFCSKGCQIEWDNSRRGKV